MSRGDIKTQTYTIQYNVWLLVQPAVGATWMITGIGASTAYIRVHETNQKDFLIGWSGSSSAVDLTQYIHAFSPAGGGCKLFITRDNNLQFRQTSSNTTNYFQIHAVEL